MTIEEIKEAGINCPFCGGAFVIRTGSPSDGGGVSHPKSDTCEKWRTRASDSTFLNAAMMALGAIPVSANHQEVEKTTDSAAARAQIIAARLRAAQEILLNPKASESDKREVAEAINAMWTALAPRGPN